MMRTSIYIIHASTSASIFEHHLDPAGYEGYQICLLVAEVKQVPVSGSLDEGKVVTIVLNYKIVSIRTLDVHIL